MNENKVWYETDPFFSFIDELVSISEKSNSEFNEAWDNLVLQWGQ